MNYFVGVIGNLITGFLTSSLLAFFIAILEGGVRAKIFRERVKLFTVLFRQDFMEWFNEYYILMEGNAKVLIS
ncbi:MAG: hypothetical protein EAX81_03300 [Candidatus Thorarchaeota archaeon]|nr:hypothetical protein [Candidatus Thorarchaeota archaeon]